MLTIVSVTAAILVVFVAYAAVAPMAMNLGRFWGKHSLTCPNRDVRAEVEVHPARAALAASYGAADLGLRRCSLLRPGDTCNEGCLRGIAA